MSTDAIVEYVSLHAPELSNKVPDAPETVRAGHYVHACAAGRFAILSLRNRQGVLRDRIVTIRVCLRSRAFVEARGRFNCLPMERFQREVHELVKRCKLKAYEF